LETNRGPPQHQRRGDCSTAQMVLALRRVVTVGVSIVGYLPIGVASILLLTSAAIHIDLGPSQQPKPVYRALDITSQALFLLGVCLLFGVALANGITRPFRPRNISLLAVGVAIPAFTGRPGLCFLCCGAPLPLSSSNPARLFFTRHPIPTPCGFGTSLIPTSK